MQKVTLKINILTTGFIGLNGLNYRNLKGPSKMEVYVTLAFLTC